MNGLLANLRALGPVKLGAMGAVAAAVFALMTALAFTGGPSPNARLYGDLAFKDAGNIAAALKAAHIRYALTDQGHGIMVEPAQLDQARLLLAQHDLPAGNSSGYAIFDHQNPLTSSDFLDRIDETRALDAELARTIELIHGITAARVQVVLPHRDDFSLRTAPAQASVMLSLAGAAPLDRQSVDAILNLVASAVPGLKPSQISIADDRGDLLAQAGQSSETLLSSRDATLKRDTERHLTEAVRTMLDAALGSNQVRVVTSVSMDFDSTAQTSTTYDPNGQVVRSQQQTQTKSSRKTNRDDTISVANNLPGAAAAKPDPKQLEQRDQTDQTTNYEISQTVKRIVHATPQITRISVAVMLADISVPGKNDKITWRPHTPATIARIQKLVESAIGYDKARGDMVDIQSMPFATPQDIRPVINSSIFARLMTALPLLSLVRILVVGLVGVVALLCVFRPMVRRITFIAEPTQDVLAGSATIAAIGAPDAQSADNHLRAVADMVERNPEASLAIVRDWLSAEASQ